ncbi:hypothetical protein PVL29_021800 [Vitis rotundifolia]|uniref:Uncharacterized protein n=1 Tax=Vitis rotundifolia TaxID=103349 RepID=A0AA38Z0V7_VITRO|nr:hypothetical protein PVL29_021800 [Vitis rotundifolia]
MEEEVPSQRGKKRSIVEISGDNGLGAIYKFKILLPNGTSLGLTLHEHKLSNLLMPLQEFIGLVRTEYFRTHRQLELPGARQKIMWKSKDIFLVDASENRMKHTVNFRNFEPHKCHILQLNDGSGQSADTFKNMWDLTPDTDLLAELPEEYAFETALADLIDNSLQAVWSNGMSERRLISVDIVEDRISIFDSGPGMDGSDENSIVKWGKMGASLHRSSKAQAIGGKPPYLKPFFGMFGYGGPIASMHLGRCAVVSSKTKESKKVYTLHLEREALLSSSGSDLTWRTSGGIRNPSEEETEKSPHGSFTKVEIFKPKIKRLNVFQLQRKLKDIYFPYIQCDEVCDIGKTNTPVEFQVNGLDLAEIDGGEVGTTNLHSSNGPEFVLQLRFYGNQDNVATKSPGLRSSQEANARLKCVYFPIVEGKENLETILEKLEAEGCGTNENYDTFSRVSIRRLGRLLPDARWSRLPFMEHKLKKGDKGQLLKRCCRRVKCFIDTDAGFNPTPSKTDLAHHNPFTKALKDFGNKPPEKGREINVEIHRDGKSLTLLQLEKEYLDWISQMHDLYDEEIDSGEDQPVIVVGSLNKKQLGISSDVVRVHEIIRRKGKSWKRGQKIKVLKGACPGCHKSNVFATLEYILLEGFQGDAGGEARLICRPLSLPDEDGCILAVDDGTASFDCRSSLSLPISVIDSGKCLAVESSEWLFQLEKQRQKAPSTIDILSERHCLELEVDGALPVDAPVYAGQVPPKEIIAVVRPASFVSSSASKNLDQKYIIKDNFASKNLDQKYIIKDNLELSMEVKLMDGTKDTKHIYSKRVTPSSRNGFHGLYIFPLGCKFPQLFQKAGVYTFTVFLKDSSFKSCEKRVLVKALPKVSSWRFSSDIQDTVYSVRAGSCLPPFSIACYDSYENQIPFTSIPEFIIKSNWNGGVLADSDKMKLELSSDNLTLKVKDVLIESSDLDKIRPSYATTLVICPRDELPSISVACEVNPGPLERAIAQPPVSDNQLLPGCVIEELVLEMFDAYGNHAREGLEVQLNVDGFCFQDHNGLKRKVDDRGCIDLSGLLRVTTGYGKNVSLSVLSGNKVVFKQELQTEKRELRAASIVPQSCAAGSQLENIVFEIINSKGEVDESVHDEEKHGQFHTLTIMSDSFYLDGSVRFAFRNGRCIIPTIPLPRKQGDFTFLAAHSCHPELSLVVKVECHVQVSVAEVPKVKQEDVQLQYPNENMLLLQDSPAPRHVENNLVESLMNDEKEIEDDICKIGLFIGDSERKLELLHKQKRDIEQSIEKLQASAEYDSFNNHRGYMSKKESVMRCIEKKDKSAAAFFCNLSRQIPFQDPGSQLMKDIVGVVALLGTVHINPLGRMLAEYLGEDQMLAVVCRSYEAASKLEKYEWDGKVDREHALYAVAKTFGKPINDRFLVICLENIRPYIGGFQDNDPQRKLNIPNPILPTGEMPPGFLGYAVNMVDLESHHLLTRTTAGHGLRETLFYCLFGELQVYQTREDMKKACFYARHGAVSLDGGIMKGNGIISFGCRELQIWFPVATLESPKNVRILEVIEEKRTSLRLKKLQKKISRCRKLMDRLEPCMKGHYLEYNTNTINSLENSPK